MQAVFLFMLVVQIDLSMKERDASQGKSGLLVIIVCHHPYTHALAVFTYKKMYTVIVFYMRKITFARLVNTF